jgi:hypothetical protein
MKEKLIPYEEYQNLLREAFPCCHLTLKLCADRDARDRCAFLTVRQELKRFGRVRKHHSLDTTPAVAAGLEEKPWSLEQVVDMTAAYFRRAR